MGLCFLLYRRHVLCYEAQFWFIGQCLSKIVWLISDTAALVSVSISTHLSLSPTNTIRRSTFVHWGCVSWSNSVLTYSSLSTLCVWQFLVLLEPLFLDRLLKCDQFSGRSCRLHPWGGNNPVTSCRRRHLYLALCVCVCVCVQWYWRRLRGQSGGNSTFWGSCTPTKE